MLLCDFKISTDFIVTQHMPEVACGYTEVVCSACLKMPWK